MYPDIKMNFNIGIAIDIGVEAAILWSNIDFWVEKNRANNKNLYDGKYWTYNTLEAFTRLFPFWTRRQIERIINTLEEKNYIIKGNFNRTPHDRTCWYSTDTDKKALLYNISPNGEMEKTVWGNGKNQTVKCSYTDNKPDNKQDTVAQNEKFEEFWRFYPRKTDKKKARLIFSKLVLEEQNKVLADIQIRASRHGPWLRDNGRFIPHPSTYLNNNRWEDEIIEEKTSAKTIIIEE